MFEPFVKVMLFLASMSTLPNVPVLMTEELKESSSLVDSTFTVPAFPVAEVVVMSEDELKSTFPKAITVTSPAVPVVISEVEKVIVELEDVMFTSPAVVVPVVVIFEVLLKETRPGALMFTCPPLPDPAVLLLMAELLKTTLFVPVVVTIVTAPPLVEPASPFA